MMRPLSVLLPTIAVGIIASALLFTWNASSDVQAVLSPSPGYGYHPVPPARVLDTRYGPGPMGAVGPGGTITVDVTGVGGVPAGDVAAVVLNTTVDQPTSASFLTVFPSDASLPLASNLNFSAGQTVPNLVIVKAGADGNVKVYNQLGSVHVIFDVAGWYGGSASTGTQAREDQIFMGDEGPTTHDNDAPGYQFLRAPDVPVHGFLTIDSSEYPASAVFSLEVILQRGNDSTNCLRLFDLTANAAVPGSDFCVTAGVAIPPTRLRSSSFVLPTGPHEYAIQGDLQSTPPGGGCCGVDVTLSRIVAEWTE